MTTDINNEKPQAAADTKEAVDPDNSPFAGMIMNLVTNTPADKAKALNSKITSQQAQIKQLETTVPGGMQANIL